jgi:hypothetical protein
MRTNHLRIDEKSTSGHVLAAFEKMVATALTTEAVG